MSEGVTGFGETTQLRKCGMILARRTSERAYERLHQNSSSVKSTDFRLISSGSHITDDDKDI